MPFNMVQMVMMHELAHNTHMNHGKNFWQARNKYAEELRVLWSRKYTGEGFWGSGRVMSDLHEVAGNNSMTAEDMKDVPVCGGTFRSRRRKRKRAGDGNEMTWKEKRDRRIEKKFGKNGQSLGEDEEQRIMLEIDRKGAIGGKPRVAQSKRGRELRAAAALARFGPNQQEVDELKKPEDESSDAEYEEDPSVKDEDAKDTNGQRLLDSMGFGVVRVCEDESPEDSQVKHEMDELAELNQEDGAGTADLKSYLRLKRKGIHCTIYLSIVGRRPLHHRQPKLTSSPNHPHSPKSTLRDCLWLRLPSMMRAKVCFRNLVFQIVMSCLKLRSSPPNQRRYQSRPRIVRYAL